MAGGGDAPAMSLPDVVILIAGSILAAGFLMMTWDDPVSIAAEKEFSQSHHLFEGDTVNLNIESNGSGAVLIEFDGETKEHSFVKSGSEKFSFTAEGGASDLVVKNVGSSTLDVDIDVERRYMLDWITFPVGILMLIWAIWRKSLDSKNV